MMMQIGWIAIRSNYSLWPAATMHFAWNRINPYLLGSIYTNAPGKHDALPYAEGCPKGAAGEADSVTYCLLCWHKQACTVASK